VPNGRHVTRIAVSGSHATGKSTLVHELARRFPQLTPVEESYYLLTEQGHAFGDPPTIDDFELLFDRSIATLAAAYPGPVIFDRSPADYLGYISALRRGVAHPGYVRAATTALATLDLVVYVPVERPDRVHAPEAPRLRRRVDALLRDMLVNQAWGFAVPVVEVRGTLNQRMAQLVTRLGALAG